MQEIEIEKRGVSSDVHVPWQGSASEKERMVAAREVIVGVEAAEAVGTRWGRGGRQCRLDVRACPNSLTGADAEVLALCSINVQGRVV